MFFDDDDDDDDDDYYYYLVVVQIKSDILFQILSLMCLF